MATRRQKNGNKSSNPITSKHGGVYFRVLRYIDPNNNSTPQASTVLWSTICFVAFVIFGVFALGYPTPWMRITVLGFNSVVFIFLVILCSNDLVYHLRLRRNRPGKRMYSRNLANTILIFILTVVTMTVLYEFVWYKNLNLWILQTRQEKIPSFRFPAMYIVQDIAHYQANLLDEQPWTCFIGAQDSNAPMCNSLTGAEVLNTTSCNCNDSWVPQLLPNFLKDDGKKSLSFLPKDNLLTKANVMTVKFNFNYNTTAQADPQLGSPNLWMFVYDPTMSVSEAYMKSYSSMRLFNAHGTSTVLLDNHYFKSRDGTARYEYGDYASEIPVDVRLRKLSLIGVVISTTPYMNLVCDVAGNQSTYTPCHGSLLLNVPGFDSTIINEQTALSWTDAVGQAGAYFALVQLVTWVITGAAWAS